ncbi:hypothetical protein IAT38_002336 [Cryptococcus sp. DSM 104549]
MIMPSCYQRSRSGWGPPSLSIRRSYRESHLNLGEHDNDDDRAEQMHDEHTDGASCGSSTSSLLSKKLATALSFKAAGTTDGYFVEGERVYYNQSYAYRFPADQDEVKRMDRQHYILSSSLPGLYRGPVDGILNDTSRSRRLLDIGCGTGVWTHEMAERFPHVDCIGIDIIPLQHDLPLANCTFMCVTAPDGMDAFANDLFDVVHIRNMLQFTSQYAPIVAQAYRVLRPGGIICIHECQVMLHSAWEGYSPEELAPGITKMTHSIRRSFTHRGIDLSVFERMEDVLVQAGFNEDDIDTYHHYRPICSEDYNSGIGQHDRENFIRYAFAARLTVLEACVCDEDEFDDLLADLTNEVSGRSEGACGPLGGQGVLSAWGYWWAIKR